ncbi:MAG TPA: 6-hydroxycyclohex-1-ene-1-carbonyl-CoA dehydrogenase [Terriglobales bacterium]|nr:6-hydroxycyclohex-1-ene-1-carbonyl-CoA dehydrogenase [Terriglobales bacterium]
MRIEGAHGFSLVAAGQRLQAIEIPDLEAGPDEVIVEVAGCGICHTDVGFAADGVPTRKAFPLILGHEISGRVVSAGDHSASWLGSTVIIPAVIPCGNCPACKAGRSTICRNQFMPGNDGDGGFATHVRVPARGLCSVPQPLPPGFDLELLSVIADAVTTPWEAIRRAAVGPDDVVVFVGVGGVGGFGVQIAAALGAAVVAVDIDQHKLELAAQHGAGLAINSSGGNEKDAKTAVRTFAKNSGRHGIGLKIFETSGTTAGQQIAFNLLDFGGYLGVIGFTPKKTELRLSNLMALDATARGNWGCPPDEYPAALDLVLHGKVSITPYVEIHPLDDAPAVFDAAIRHAISRRVILKNTLYGKRERT